MTRKKLPLVLALRKHKIVGDEAFSERKPLIPIFPAIAATFAVLQVRAENLVDGFGGRQRHGMHHIAEAAVFLGGDPADGFGVRAHGSGSSTASPVTWGRSPNLVEL